MTNTLFRLLVLLPAAALMFAITLAGVQVVGLSFGTTLLGLLLAGVPLALIGWTIADDRKRARKRSGR